MNKFVLKPVNRGGMGVFYENDDIQICVGEISKDHIHGWRFHFNAIAGMLKTSATAELKTFAQEQIAIIKVTERLTK